LIVKESRASTHKKVIVRKLNKDEVKGYVNPSAFLGPADMEMLDLDGRLLRIPLEEIRGVYFVREFEGAERREERKIFLSRPKLSGLWVRMTCKDTEVLDGIITDSLLNLLPQGFHVTPPDVYSNNLRIFVPRSALASLEVLSVISDGARRPRPRASSSRRYARDSSTQLGLFPPPGSPQIG
jgi:hypothetical protein